MNEDIPILYSFRRCPYAVRARLVMATLGYRVELREVLLKEKPEAMLKVSPKGSVPVLVLPDGRVIDESLDVIHHVMEASVIDNGLTLKGENSDHIKALIEENDQKFIYHLDRYKYATRYEGADAAAHRDQALLFIEKLEVMLNGNHYLFGDKVTYADAAILPFVRQYRMPDPKWFDGLQVANVRRWLDTYINSSIFLTAMKKYQQWHQDDDPIYYPTVN